MEHPIQKAIPAATLVIFKDAEAGPPELLMVRRSNNMVFAAGAVVFPGGRVDADDHYLAKIFATGMDEDEGAARIAAIRETLEETGVPIGIEGDLSADTVARARADILEGTDFSEVVARHKWRIAPDQLEPFARWCPAHKHERIFDTRFYLADGSHHEGEVSVSGGENSHAFWTSAQDMLDRADAGESHIIFPTRRNLERLALFRNLADAIEQARAHPVKAITPYFETVNGVDSLSIESGLGYPVTSEALETIKRG